MYYMNIRIIKIWITLICCTIISVVNLNIFLLFSEPTLSDMGSAGILK